MKTTDALHLPVRQPGSLFLSRHGLLLGLAAATLLRLWLGWTFFGFHTGDDVEVLQAGFLRAFGGGYQPWEIRNLLVSDVLVAPLLGLARRLGIESMRVLVWVASWPFVALASLNGWLVYRLGRRWLECEGTAALAGLLYLFHWVPLGYGSMVYPRTASTTCVLLAALALGRGQAAARWQLLAGGLLGVAWAVRYSEALFLLPLALLVALEEDSWRRRLAGWLWLAAGFVAASLVTVGFEDWLRWGRPFASLVAFAHYTLVERQASAAEPVQPWYWYLWRLPKWIAPVLWPLLWSARRLERSWRPALCAAVPLLGLTLVFHKQLRYLQGVVPFVALLAAAGAAVWWRAGQRRWVWALLALYAAVELHALGFLAGKSMAAVVAAESLAGEAAGRELCLEQSWAYGGTLYLGAAGIKDLERSLAASQLGAAIAGCDWLGLYERDVARQAGWREELTRRGFVLARTVRWGDSEAVTLWRPRGEE